MGVQDLFRGTEMKTDIGDYKILLEVSIKDLFCPSSLLVTHSSDRRLFFIYLNNETVPVELPLWQVKQKANSAKNFVHYLRNKLG